MIKKQTSVFWKAGVLTIIVFCLGVLLGYSLERGRVSEIEKEYIQIEIEWADAKLQSMYYQTMDNESCRAAVDENLKFSDRVYQQGLRIERYEDANKLTEKIQLEKRKYALLKTEFLLNSITLKERCSEDYVNLIYFYRDKPTMSEKSSQRVQSIILKEIKDMFGADVMLIPLPTDMDISVIEIIKNSYNITKFPALIINNKKFEGVVSKEDIMKTVCSFYKKEVQACKGYE